MNLEIENRCVYILHPSPEELALAKKALKEVYEEASLIYTTIDGGVAYLVIGVPLDDYQTVAKILIDVALSGVET